MLVQIDLYECLDEKPHQVWVMSQDLPLDSPMVCDDYKKDVRFINSLNDEIWMVAVGSWTHKPNCLVCESITFCKD
jgi:phage pi2 protein 07